MIRGRALAGRVRWRVLAVLVLGLCLPVLASSAAAAADFTWTGTGSFGPWSNAGNWAGGVAPSGAVGRLTFPILTSPACTARPPTAPCYTNGNDISGLSINALAIDDGKSYNIVGNAITLGAGGLTASSASSTVGFAAIDFPITLGASQQWSIDGNNGRAALGLELGYVTGPSIDALGINLSSQAALLLSNHVEVGPVAITGANTSDTGNSASLNGNVSLNGSTSLNANSPAQPVSVTDAGLVTDTTANQVGPLTSTGGNIVVGVGGTPAGSLTVNGGVTLDSASAVKLFIDHSGTVAGSDYSQISATAGNVNLSGASLTLSGSVDGSGGCPALTAGEVDTLITTAGAMTGTFADIPEATIVPVECSSGTTPTVRINYTAHAVTATVVAPPPMISSLPMISGSAVQGQTLTEAHGTWTGSPTGFTYQWFDCDGAGNGCSPIAGPAAQNQSYTLAPSDVGHTIVVQETASNLGGSSAPASSAATGVVQSSALPPSGPVKPANSSSPVVSGSAVVGQSLSSSAGVWSGTSPISYVYQWQRCDPGCSSIGGASASSYTLTNADVGARIAIVVTATNAVGQASAASAEVGPVAPSAAQIKALLSKMLVPRGKPAKIGAILKAGGYTFTLKALTAGTATIGWYVVPKGAHLTKGNAPKPILVAKGKLRLSNGTTSKLRLKMTAKGRRLLKHATRIKLTAKASFTPTGKSTLSTTKKFTLKR